MAQHRSSNRAADAVRAIEGLERCVERNGKVHFNVDTFIAVSGTNKCSGCFSMELQVFCVYARGREFVPSMPDDRRVQARQPAFRRSGPKLCCVICSMVLSGPTTWTTMLHWIVPVGTWHLHNKVKGVTLAQPPRSATAIDVLFEQARVLKDYHDLTSERKGHLITFIVVAAVLLERAAPVHAMNTIRELPRTIRKSPRTRFGLLSRINAQNCNEAAVLEEPPDHNVLLQRAEVHNESMRAC